MVSVSRVDTVQIMYFEMTANKRPVKFTGRLFACSRDRRYKTHLSVKNGGLPCLKTAILEC